MYIGHIIHIRLKCAEHGGIGERFVHDDNDIRARPGELLRRVLLLKRGKDLSGGVCAVACGFVYRDVFEFHQKCDSGAVALAHDSRREQLVVHAVPEDRAVQVEHVREAADEHGKDSGSCDADAPESQEPPAGTFQLQIDDRFREDQQHESGQHEHCLSFERVLKIVGDAHRGAE